ncbi:zeta toxin family protein [Alkalimonas sp.]|uniref:zeta toxin family protein n=1 Tax=Alkalimonas sp. TaxID=1872453 RepID=UPI00263BDC88|nr:zeta toxin family protein [Alkalimonas sp.]MCC5824620.1 zeta toxin family protein [Alkalimonas sp.]
MPTCWIIAGPNGAGKTTFALEFLPAVAKCHNFINADLIAAGLSPLAPEKELFNASRLFLTEIQNRIQAKVSFAFETTLAGRAYLKLVKKLQAEGWQVELIYLALPNSKVSQLRVAERVKHGGHNIPLNDIKRRFPQSLANLLLHYSSLVDHCQCYMNADAEPLLIFEQRGSARFIKEPTLFDNLVQGATYDEPADKKIHG